MNRWIKTAVLTFALVICLCNLSEATKWYEYDNEDGVVGNALPSSINGPYFFEYNSPGTYRSDSVRSKFAELQTINNQNAYYIQIFNPNGTYGTPLGRISVAAGNTYYLAGFFRFQRIDGKPIWHSVSDFDKLLEFHGSGFRWIIVSGFTDVTNYVSGKLTFSVNVAKSSVSAWAGYDQLAQNFSGYSTSKPFQCDYEKWHSVVMGITARANSSGLVRLWIDGTQVINTSGQTMMSGATIDGLGLNGTIGQPDYNAPAHKRQFDRIILTDSWQDIVNGGYVSGDDPGPLPPSGLRVVTP